MTDIRRIPVRSGFRYTVGGRVLRDADEIARIEALAIPPAWRDVVITRSPRAKVLARGTDAAGRRQAIYSPAYRRKQDRKKFARMERFARELPGLRRRIRHDLRERDVAAETVVACVVRLLDRRGLRIGSRRYAREHDSYGATTLLKQHVRVQGATISFDFPGKSGRRHHVTLRDRGAARVIERLLALPGESLFVYRSGAGDLRPVTRSTVNAYIQRFAGSEFRAKDFRTWGASRAAVDELLSELRSGARTVSSAQLCAAVAQHLANTPAVARTAYLDPRIVSFAADPACCAYLRRARRRLHPQRDFSLTEQCVIKVLDRA